MIKSSKFLSEGDMRYARSLAARSSVLFPFSGNHVCTHNL